MWQGSDHDLAMDVATPETVLGDFNDATLEHFGIISRMYRDGDRFCVTTEGPDGQLAEFEVKYVFGVEPLQQYMVEFDRPHDMPEHEIARLQVLRLSWDTERQKWFYLSPPDVDERLLPNDPLHWTGVAQNWNHMCAECHSTNLQKNYDLATSTYHTTFSDMDVSCEACHGPGSVHVELASAKSPFWDRKLGYGLAQLKSKSSEPQLHACAPCHSRRNPIAPGYRSGENYYDHYANALLEPETYYCDGQIRDEVYVFGSFIQSKMYREGIRCTDCHNPHTTKVKFSDNTLCTSCHTHEAKYDTPAHHRHKAGSAGASCVECHMPETPYMDVDLRRDHSLRIPRPDLSVQLGTPNACTGCHLEPENVAPDKRAGLEYYADWLQARDGDNQVRDEIARVDRWAAEQVREWYGPLEPDKDRVEFAAVLKRRLEIGTGCLRAIDRPGKESPRGGHRPSQRNVALGLVSDAAAHARLPRVAPGSRSANPRGRRAKSVGTAAARVARNARANARRPDPLRAHRSGHGVGRFAGRCLYAATAGTAREALDEYRASLMVNADLATAAYGAGGLGRKTERRRRCHRRVSDSDSRATGRHRSTRESGSPAGAAAAT